MAATLEQFKQAFSGKVSVDPLVKSDRQAESALKELQRAVQSLDKAAPATERFQSALVDLVTRYSETKKGNGRPQDQLGQVLEGIHRDTLAQFAQVKGDVESGNDPHHDGHLDDAKVSMGPRGDETLYRNNLKGIQAELDKVLKGQAPDSASRDIQKRLRDVYDMMTAVAGDGDFGQALVYADELPGILEEYKRAVAAYNKRDQAGREAQDAFETRYSELEWEIQSLIEFKTSSADARGIQDEMLREKEQIDLAVLEANFAMANTHLDKLADAMKRFRASLQKHKQEVDAKYIKDAPKRTYEANLNAIKTRLDALTKSPPGPKDPNAAQLKKIAELKKQLQKQMSVKEPDYAAGSKLVDEIRRQIAQYDLSVAAQQKVKDDAAEAKAKSTYATDLEAVDFVIKFHYEMNVGGGAAWDKQAIAILDKLTKARALYKQQEPYLGYRARQASIDQMKALVADYKAANSAAWQGVYEKSRSQMPEKDLKWALDPAWGEGAMKKEQQKLKDLFKAMESAAASKSWYEAATKASILYQNLSRLKTINYTTPGSDGKETTVRPQLLGPPLDAPTVYTLLRLLRKDGSGSIDHPEGAKLNKSGESVLDKWQRLIDRKTQWTKDIDTLKKDAAKITTALQNVKNAAKAIAKGAGPAELRKTIEEYVKAEGHVAVAAKDLETAFHSYEQALKGYTGAVLEQSRISAERKKTGAQQKHDDEAKKVEERKNQIRNAAGMIANILDPKKWITYAASLMAVGAMELAASLVPEQKLNQLKNELDVAIQQLQQIEDELGIVKVEGALAGLKAATSSQDGKRLTFEKKLESLEMVSARIVATMKKSPPLSEGAKALELRGAFEGAKRSTMVYIEAAETLDVDLQQLAGRYSSFGSAFSDSATKYQDAVRATAGGNATTLYEVSVHLKSLIPSAKSAQDYATTAGDKASSVGFYKMLPELKKAIL